MLRRGFRDDAPHKLTFYSRLHYINLLLHYTSVIMMSVGVDICQERGADCLHTVQLTALPSQNYIISYYISSLHHLNPDLFYLSGTGLPRLSWKSSR